MNMLSYLSTIILKRIYLVEFKLLNKNMEHSNNQSEQSSNAKEPQDSNDEFNVKLSAQEEERLLEFLNKVEKCAKDEPSLDSTLFDQLKTWKDELTTPPPK